MKKLSLIIGGLALGAAMMLLPQSGNASIVGSKHDFTSYTNYWIGGTVDWALGGHGTNICGECHTIHHAIGATTGPLWIHTPTSQTFKTYDQGGSETFPSGLTVTLGTSTTTCLGCHDGSVAINSTEGFSSGAVTSSSTNGTAGVYASSSSVVIEVNGTQDDLTHMHPVGVKYSDAITAMPTGDLNPVTTPIAGGTVANVMLKNGNVECSSCHDIHRTQGTASTSGIYTIASGQTLCLACHNK